MSRTRTRRYLEPLSGCFVGLGKYESIYLSRSSTEYPLRGFLFSTVPFLDGCNRTGMTPAIAISGLGESRCKTAHIGGEASADSTNDWRV